MKLRVESARIDDVLEDVVRVNEKHRVDGNGQRIETGTIYSVKVGGQKVYAVARGTAEEGVISMDEAIRDRLRVSLGDTIDPLFAPAGIWGEQIWGWRASHPVTRAAARLGIISLVLGVVGLVLGIISLFH